MRGNASIAQVDPIARFRKIYERARRHDPDYYTRVALATADTGGRPSVRMVLLKSFDERGFVFYTNYESRKASDMEQNPRAALCFYWECIDEQIRVEGTVAQVSAEESDAYFASRPRGSQIAACVSKQSAPLASRVALIRDYLKLRAKYAGRPVPRPDFWGGYRLSPERMEFWSSKAHRLHDRALFTRDGEGWRLERLYP
jgi:pyridoxamine 5'-phosphate oxidase